MALHSQHRQRIHYVLIACILFLQFIIMVFFYNEYFNEKKLTEIEDQIQDSRTLKSLTKDARQDLATAQSSLQKYSSLQEKQYLEDYFQSLRKLSVNIDSIYQYGNTNSSTRQQNFQPSKDVSDLVRLNKLIDSTYKAAQKPIKTKNPPKIKKIEIKEETVSPDVEIHHISDSAEKKKLLPRLKDAITGKVDVKRDTTVIIANYTKSIDTVQVMLDLDSTIQAVDVHYKKEIEKYQNQIDLVDTQNRTLHQTYDNLLVLSNELMAIYDQKVEEFNSDLEQEYETQNSLNHKIRRFSVFGLMILMLIVLGVLIYYTKLSFLVEKELKEANRKIEENLNFKNRILGMLSHEVRGPLKIMNIFIKRMQKKTDDPRTLDQLKTIEFTNNSLLVQANQILDYAKNQERPLQLKPKVFHLREEIEAVLKMYVPYTESKNNSFEREIEIPSEIQVYTDNLKIHQIFINLLENANKFTENGKIRVEVNSEILKSSKLKLNVKIMDSGIGIAEQDLQKIFKPYYQGNLSEEMENMGAGLGLNLCKEIIELFNGTISVESILHQGTTISFDLYLHLQHVES